MSEPIRVASVQMVSTPRVEDNLQRMQHWVGQAALRGAKLVLLPEYFCIMGNETDKVRVREPHGLGAESPIQRALSETAAKHKVWIVGGTVPLVDESPDHVRNSVLVFDPQGQQVARYDKIHLFAFTRGQESYNEAKTITPGSQPVAVDTIAGRTALSVCYDLRFPELYRNLGAAAPLDLIVMPAAFTYTTGRAHWELLIRARAVENQCYVLASAQGGTHENGRRTWGQSMLVDPWGEIVDQQSEGEGLVMGEVDHHRMQEIRLNLPALNHRVIGTRS